MSDWQQQGQGGGAAEEGGSNGGGGMEEAESENEAPREDAPNPTQEAIDEGGASDQPADVGWEETADTPHQGEAGQSQEPA
jgi:hypothetical protein